MQNYYTDSYNKEISLLAEGKLYYICEGTPNSQLNFIGHIWSSNPFEDF